MLNHPLHEPSNPQNSIYLASHAVRGSDGCGKEVVAGTYTRAPELQAFRLGPAHFGNSHASNRCALLHALAQVLEHLLYSTRSNMLGTTWYIFLSNKLLVQDLTWKRAQSTSSQDYALIQIVHSTLYKLKQRAISVALLFTENESSSLHAALVDAMTHLTSPVFSSPIKPLAMLKPVGGQKQVPYSPSGSARKRSLANLSGLDPPGLDPPRGRQR